MLKLNMAKKILIFSTAYYPFVGGAEVAIKEITDRLNDFEFYLITPRFDNKLKKEEKIGNVLVYRVGFGWGKLDKFFIPLLGFLKAGKLEKKHKFDIVWAFMASQAAVAASFFKIISKKKMVLNIQEGDPENHLQRYAFGIKFLYKIFIRPWHILPFKKADYVTVISSDLKERARKSGAKCEIKIIPNGVDLEKFQNLNCNFQINKSNLGFKEDDKILITTSRLVKKNAVSDVIKSLQYLPDNIKFLILGVGPLEKNLKNLTDKLNLRSRIKFAGQINHEELPGYFNLADIFIRPSLSEGLGNSFLEAMAFGLPIIGTPVGGITDFLKHKETGLVCEVNNPKDIAEKVESLLEDDDLRIKIIQNGKRLVKEEYNWDNIAKETEKIFLKI